MRSDLGGHGGGLSLFLAGLFDSGGGGPRVLPFDGSLWEADGRVALAIVVMAMLLGWRHSENIGRLLAGKESKLGQKKAP